MTLKQLTILLLLGLYACNSPVKKSDNTSINSEEVTADSNHEDARINLSTFKTSTGKSIEVLEKSENRSESSLILVPKGFPNSNDSITLKNIDPVKEILIRDLDENGFDEIYVITQNSGSGTYGNVYAYASNNDLSLSPVYFPDITEQDLEKGAEFEGYMGHDSIYTDSNLLMRKFPVYKPGDPNCCPTGGNKTVAYQLKPGEASWMLKRIED